MTESSSEYNDHYSTFSPKKRYSATRPRVIPAKSYAQETSDASAYAKMFNSMLIKTQSQVLSSEAKTTEDLSEIMNSLPFQSLLQVSQNLSKELGVSFPEAAAQVIDCFRSLDKVWNHYVFQKGMESMLQSTSNISSNEELA